ncbi:hypothetical protein OCA28_17000 [Bacillus cereus]|nr:hypothetical protein [Bacillus cereus]
MGTKVGKCKKCDFIISQKNMKNLLNGEQTDLIKEFKKNDKAFDARLEWKENKVNFLFDKE